MGIPSTVIEAGSDLATAKAVLVKPEAGYVVEGETGPKAK